MQASLFGYVETEYPLAPREQVEANRQKTAELARFFKRFRRAV